MASLQEKEQYAILKRQEAEINASCAELKRKLEVKALEIIRLQQEQTDLVRQLNDSRGGEKWVLLKAEIARLAMRGAARGYVPTPVKHVENTITKKKKWYEVWR